MVEERIITQVMVSQTLIQLRCRVKVIKYGKTASRIIRQPEQIIVVLLTDAMVSDQEHCLISAENDHRSKLIKYKKFYKILVRWLTSAVSTPLTKTIFPLESVDSPPKVNILDKRLLNNRFQQIPKHGINWLIDLYLRNLSNYIKAL